MSKSKLGTIIDGCFGSSHIDSSGESIDVEGADISSLGGPESILNWEHESKGNPSQVIGKVTFAKKLFKRSDCSNDRERYWWDKVKKPMIYGKAELFDGVGHAGAKDVAAILRYDNRDKGKRVRNTLGFSVEGGTMQKSGMVVKKSIIRDIAITVKPCNKISNLEILDDITKRKDLYKNEESALPMLSKGGMREFLLENLNKGEKSTEYLEKIKKAEKPLKKLDTYKTENNMRKALMAGMMNATPSSLTGMAALSPENLMSTAQDVTDKKKKKSKKKLKKGQPNLSFNQLAKPNRPDMSVKTQFHDPFSAMSVQKEVEKPDFDPKYDAAGIATEDKAFAFGTNDQSREEMMQTKGKGNYPHTKHHEGFHKHLFDVSKNSSPEHAQSLVRHILDTHFHPDDRRDVNRFVKGKGYGKDNFINEETITHTLDLLTRPDVRDKFHKQFDLGEEGNMKRHNRLKSSWLNAVKDAKTIDRKKLDEIHDNYLKKDKEVSSGNVEVQRIPAGKSGLQR